MQTYTVKFYYRDNKGNIRWETWEMPFVPREGDLIDRLDRRVARISYDPAHPYQITVDLGD